MKQKESNCTLLSVLAVLAVLAVSQSKAKISGKRIVQGTFFHRLWPIQFCVIALQTEMLFSNFLQLPK